MWLDNLTAYSIQIAILLAAGAVAARLLLAQAPNARLICWQTLLAVSLLLPVVQPWQATGDGVSVEVSTQPIAVRRAPSRRVPLRLPQTIAIILASGVAIRLTLFGLGLARLTMYRRKGRPVPDHRAEIRLSDEVPGPVTFGLFRPVILIPPEWAGNEAVLNHELIHVQRRDWVFMAVEEFVRALLWFHPLVWYAIAQIQLAREQVVDREVIRLTQSREQYLQTLLAIAAARSGLDLAPAPLFLRKRHLKSRVASLMKEVNMSRVRLNASLAGMLALTLAAGFVAVRAFPLQAAAQESQQDTPKRIRVGGNVQAAKLIRKVTPKYPPQAKADRIQGKVELAVVIGADGAVKTVEVISGHPDLVDAAVEAVKQWVYETTLLNGQPVEVQTQVDVNFTLAA